MNLREGKGGEEGGRLRELPEGIKGFKINRSIHLTVSLAPQADCFLTKRVRRSQSLEKDERELITLFSILCFINMYTIYHFILSQSGSLTLIEV